MFYRCSIFHFFIYSWGPHSLTSDDFGVGPKSTKNLKDLIFVREGGGRGAGSAEEALALELLNCAAKGEGVSVRHASGTQLGETGKGVGGTASSADLRLCYYLWLLLCVCVFGFVVLWDCGFVFLCVVCGFAGLCVCVCVCVLVCFFVLMCLCVFVFRVSVCSYCVYAFVCVGVWKHFGKLEKHLEACARISEHLAAFEIIWKHLRKFESSLGAFGSI